jgi:hypothetical protein
MMLFYKAWRESRARFLAGALALAVYCAFMIFFRPQLQVSFPARLVDVSFGEYMNAQVFGGMGKILFVALVIFLGLGGLLRERAHRTAAFTLALPVSRVQLVGAQMGVGLAELALLAWLPALLMPPLSALVHQSYPVAEASRYGLLRFTCGAEIFAMSYLLSVVLRWEYTAPVACFMALGLQARVAGWSPLRPYSLNLLRALDGRWDWNATVSQVNGPLPWTDLSIMMLIALALFAAATSITQRQDL